MNELYLANAFCFQTDGRSSLQLLSPHRLALIRLIGGNDHRDHAYLRRV